MVQDTIYLTTNNIGDVVLDENSKSFYAYLNYRDDVLKVVDVMDKRHIDHPNIIKEAINRIERGFNSAMEYLDSIRFHKPTLMIRYPDTADWYSKLDNRTRTNLILGKEGDTSFCLGSVEGMPEMLSRLPECPYKYHAIIYRHISSGRLDALLKLTRPHLNQMYDILKIWEEVESRLSRHRDYELDKLLWDGIEHGDLNQCQSKIESVRKEVESREKSKARRHENYKIVENHFQKYGYYECSLGYLIGRNRWFLVTYDGDIYTEKGSTINWIYTVTKTGKIPANSEKLDASFVPFPVMEMLRHVDPSLAVTIGLKS